MQVGRGQEWRHSVAGCSDPVCRRYGPRNLVSCERVKFALRQLPTIVERGAEPMATPADERAQSAACFGIVEHSSEIESGNDFFTVLDFPEVPC